METFKLWLETDKEIHRFKRLAYEKVKVSLTDVLTIGIHPWQGGNTHKTLGEKFVQILNSDDLKSGEMKQANYCSNISHASYYMYYYDSSPFEETLKRIKEGVYFVDKFSYMELINIAKERLQNIWCHKIAYNLLEKAYPEFGAMRSFLRKKDKRIKLSGYADINQYNLGHKLSLSDFEGEDNLIISEGIPVTNFRSAHFLKKVTDNRGLLKLIDSIEHFQIQINYPVEGQSSDITTLYNCQSNGEKIRFRPELDKDPDNRANVREFASRWQIDQGRYCFLHWIIFIQKKVLHLMPMLHLQRLCCTLLEVI